MAWLSEDPAVAHTERLYLGYSVVWIAAVAVVQLGGIMDSWSDPTYLLFSVGCALPLAILPLLRPAPSDRGRPIHERYWFRLNLWLAVLTWVGSYFISHYFFQELGMRYQFPVTWTLDASIAPTSPGHVPIFMYPLTQAYFVTYHVLMVVLLRRFRALASGALATALFIGIIAYVVAFAETFAMANPLLERYFGYADREWMLKVGSTAYATLFLASLPMAWRLATRQHQWSTGRVAIEGLATSMLMLMLIDAWALVSQAIR